MYVNPPSSLFTTIINEKTRRPNVPIAVVLNPTGSGVGDSALSNYTTVISSLNNAGIITLGYVYTGFATEPQSAVEAEIAKWKSFYPLVKGIYFGAMSTQSANQTYYSNLHTYARVTQGFVTTVGGAGNTVPTSFLGSVCADTIIVYEGAGLPLPSNYQQYDSFADNNIGLIGLGVAAFNAEWTNQISAYAGWVYMTSDSGANPYDTLPSYLPTMIDRLDAIGAGLSTGSNTDSFGIRKIYHTKSGGEEWYVNLADPSSDPRFQNEPALTHNADGSWGAQGSSPSYFVRLEAWSPAYSDTTQRINAKWRNVEITGYVKCEQEFTSGTYLFQWYTRGGHHTSSGNRCEGTAYKARLWRRRISDSDSGLGSGFTKEICHSAYTTGPANQAVVRNAIPWSSTGFYNRWLGMKFVIYNVVIDGIQYPRKEIWIDRNVQDGSGNLSIQNEWAFITSYTDTGGWCTPSGTGTSFDSDCSTCSGYTPCMIHRAPGGNTTSGSSNFNRNLVAWRTDGIRWRFMQLTAREIDPEQPATGDPTPPPSTDPPSAFDSFGVRKIYATKTGGNEWYLANTPSTDSRFTNNVTMTRNTDNISWKIENSSNILLSAYQPNGYNSGLTATNAQNHGQCAQNGFMQDASDWTNVEMTAYVRVISVGSGGGGELVWFARGGRHLDPSPNCEGSSMKGFLRTDGASRFAKEQWHSAYHYTTYASQLGQSIITGNWVGFKYVVYNKLISGTPVVKQEIWVDILNDNTWIKIDERSDAGGWGLNGRTPCNGFTDDMLITWGGPIATFRGDNFSNIDFKWLSVREIEADAIAIDPPPPQGGGSCGS